MSNSNNFCCQHSLQNCSQCLTVNADYTFYTDYHNQQQHLYQQQHQQCQQQLHQQQQQKKPKPQQQQQQKSVLKTTSENTSNFEVQAQKGEFKLSKDNKFNRVNLNETPVYVLEGDITKLGNKCHDTEEVNVKSKICDERISKCNYKYLEPKKTKPSRLVINQEPDTYSEPSPPIVIHPETKILKIPTINYRQKPPSPPEQLDEVINIPGRIIKPCQRVVEIVQKPVEPVQDVYTVLWKPYKQDINIVYNKKETQNIPSQKNTRYIIEPCYIDKVSRIELPTETRDTEEFKKQYGNQLKDAKDLPECIQDLVQDLQPEYRLTGDLEGLEALRGFNWEDQIKSPVLKELLREHLRNK